MASGAHVLTSSELSDIYVDDGTWYTWYESTARDFDFIMFVFTNTHPEEATLNWQVGIDDPDNPVHMCYWYSPNMEWIEFDANEGGINPPPPTRHPDVSDEINHDEDAKLFIVMAVGYTPPQGDWITCDVCDIDR